MRRGKASPKTSRTRVGTRVRQNNGFRDNDTAVSLRPIMLNPNGFAFPPKLRANLRVAFNQLVTFSSAANNYQVISLTNVINTVASQNLSGLAWLLSGPQTNGTSYAPYTLAVARRAKIEIYAKTVQSATNPTGTLLVLYPLAYGASSSALSITNAEEQFGRSSITELPTGIDFNSHSRPLITKTYNLWDLVGVSESVYMNTPESHSCTYAGLASGVIQQCVCVLNGTESAVVDASLQTRINYILDFEIEFYGRNGNIVSPPHS
jgi:hypothetical protein